jgi:hypothetical protein
LIIQIDELENHLTQGPNTKLAEKFKKIEEDLHPLEFNLTVSNTNGSKTKFGNFIEPNRGSRTPLKPPPEQNPKEDPLRKSVLVKDHNKDYEDRKRLIKSVLQRMEAGNVYQKANDLLDAAIIMFSKRLDTEMGKALQELKSLILTMDEKLPIDTMEDLIKLAFSNSYEKDAEGVSQALTDLEKVFINGLYDFMPDYLSRNSLVRIAGGDAARMANELALPIELERLKKDNEKLKKDVTFLKDQKATLERVIQ